MTTRRFVKAAAVALLGLVGGASRAESSGLRRRLDEAANRLADWPQLARYHSDNAALPRPRPGEARVVFIGDSITDYWGRETGEFFPGKPYVNRGIAGQTTEQVVLRMRPDALALQPRAVVILAGTNDLAAGPRTANLAQIAANLTTMVQLCRAANVKVVMASLLPVHDHANAVSATRPPQKIIELNHWIRDCMRDRGGTYLDYHSAMTARDGMLRRELSADGLHPNEAGYAIMQPLAQQALDAALRKK
jgi:lysophospholipase L1-like esterase